MGVAVASEAISPAMPLVGLVDNDPPVVPIRPLPVTAVPPEVEPAAPAVARPAPAEPVRIGAGLLSPYGNRRVYEAVSRALDVVGAAVGLVVTAPVLAAAAVAIRLDSKGPAVFRQTRAGRGGKPFTLIKFRGMHVDARERFPEMYAYQYRPDELPSLRFHPDVDPRVTRVGRFLRHTSIDELPNLWNVLRGDMSLVGPRPEIPEMLKYYGDDLETVLSTKPGLTSLAKCTGRDQLTFTSTLALDVEYVSRRCLALDLDVLLRTVGIVLRQRYVSAG